MGFSKKAQVDSGIESEAKKWVIAGISIRTSLKPVSTKHRAKAINENGVSVVADDDDVEEGLSTTPTAKEARIPERLPCPPAPRKRRPSSSSCNFNGAREFFNPPDLESVFKCYLEKAK